uniref:Uncharacterized protein n=1 Tax=Lepeophtheirus salmonis TaxID=72036 RepID=A0A0K2TJZ5_LEPSM
MRANPKAYTRSRKIPKRLKELVEAVKCNIQGRRVKVTVNGLARKFECSQTIMRRVVKQDLSINTYKITLVSV